MEIIVVEDYKFDNSYMEISVDIIVPITWNVANGSVRVIALCNDNRLLICTYWERQIVAITIDLGKIEFCEQTVK